MSPNRTTTPSRKRTTMNTRTERFGVSWEESYGYVQAVQRGDIVYLSGQVAHRGEELVAHL
jgi:enamine deaminase RidA (YjgF/YER057c/UK114 family)